LRPWSLPAIAVLNLFGAARLDRLIDELDSYKD
jgi:hypothetical protein